MFAMSFVELLLLSVFVGYNTISGIENVDSYHGDTDFLPLDSAINTEHTLCNATYSENNVTRQLASRSNKTEPYTILCNISGNNRSTNDTPLQTCVDVFADIEIKFSCYNITYSYIEYFNFTTSYPYDNGTLDVIHNCSYPILNDLKPRYQSNLANWSYCEDISKMVLPNCSVACIGNICSINTRCVNEIDPRCLVPKYTDMYIRTIYDCVHHSKLLTQRDEYDSLHSYIECRDRGLINISDISIQQIRNHCPAYVNPNKCLISDEDNARILNTCNNQINCSMDIELNTTCDSRTAYAYFSISYNCSKKNANSDMYKSNCRPVNETTKFECDSNGESIIVASISINFYPHHVLECLKINNISLEFKPDVCDGSRNTCEINLFKIFDGRRLYPCLVVQTRRIHIEYNCIKESQQVIGEASPAPPHFTKPHTDVTSTIVFGDRPTTSKEEITKAEPVSVGPITGGIVGSIVFVAIVVILAVCWRRFHIIKHQSNGQSEDMVGSLIRQNSLKDYTGIQMVAYPGEGHEHLTNKINGDSSDNFQSKYESDQREHFKGTERQNDSDKCASEYTLGKPIPNKLHLQLEKTETDCGYSMAKRISKGDTVEGNFNQDSSELVTAGNEYEDSPEGFYDQAKTKRNKNNGDVYDRATDDTYDTANHCAKQRTDDADIAYDHFTGPKTIDNYELVMRHNKIAIDDTYGVN